MLPIENMSENAANPERSSAGKRLPYEERRIKNTRYLMEKRARAKEARKKRKADGLCAQCGKSPPIDGAINCALHEAKRLENTQKQKEKSLAAVTSGKCNRCHKREAARNRRCCHECYAKRARDASPQARDRARIERAKVIALYGGVCACCGENNPKYLQLDHVRDDGHAERKMTKKNWREANPEMSSCLRFRGSGPRPDLQLLCANCHGAKSWYGGCDTDDHPPFMPKKESSVKVPRPGPRPYADGLH